jgi:protein gp37
MRHLIRGSVARRFRAACDHCYAENWAKRTGHPELWQGERRRTSVHNWAQPVKWDRRAKAERRRLKVFCASLADWLDNQVDEQWREDLAELIEETPNLDWLLLTKRPQNFETLAPWHNDDVPPNVWLGTTAENQEEAERRIPILLDIPAAKHFISAEPLLGPINLRHLRRSPTSEAGVYRTTDALTGKLDWVIVGGESGPNARPMHPEWARKLRGDCVLADVPFFFKQWGEYAPLDNFAAPGPDDGSLTDEDRGAVYRVGKKAAGRRLDGREWNETP